jgi:hypothetical protein
MTFAAQCWCHFSFDLIVERPMFTTLIAGLCAFVLENTENPIEVRVPAGSYPAVAIGFIGRDKCRVGLVLGEGQSTPLIPTNGHLHSFRVETIAEASAVLTIDDRQSFSILRANVF